MNLICGINPVLEALNARTRHFDRLLVVKGLRNSCLLYTSPSPRDS